MTDRATVVRIAKSWCGTPYVHAGRIKGQGVDCLTLLAGVFEDAGLVGRARREVLHEAELVTGGDEQVARRGALQGGAEIVADDARAGGAGNADQGARGGGGLLRAGVVAKVIE